MAFVTDLLEQLGVGSVALSVAAVLFVVLLLLDARSGTNVTGPDGLPFFHGTATFVTKALRSEVDEWLSDWMSSRGLSTIRIRLFGQPLQIVTTDPANVEQILRTKFDNYVKGPFFYNRLSTALGDGIFAVDGEKWRPQRKMTAMLFNVNHFQTGMTDVFQKHGKELQEEVEKVLGKSIDVQDLYHRFTLDSICMIAFGKHVGSLRDPTVKFARIWDIANETLAQRFLMPDLAILRKILPRERQLPEQVKYFKEYAAAIIQERRAEMARGEAAEKSDLLSLYLSRRDDDGNEFSDEFLTDMVLNIILAGRDTTAQSLTWTTMLLAKHPEVLRKLVAEIDEHVGDEMPTYQHIQAMDYLYAVVSESIRLYPSVPRDPKMAINDDVLPDGTIVPAGTLVLYFPFGMGRNKDIWGPDAAEFRPERFLKEGPDGQPMRVKPSPYKFSAFQAGYRTCLGQNMAYLEESMVLAMLLQRFTFKLVPGQQFKIRLNLTSPMANGLHVVFERRTDKPVA